MAGVFASLTNVTSQFSSRNGINVELKHDELRASEFSVSHNNADGIVIDSADPQSTSRLFHLDSCSVHDNRGSGFKVTAAAAITVRNCVIHSNRLDAVTTDQRQGGSFRLEQSLVYKNQRSALQVNSDGVYLDSCTIRDHHYGYWWGRRWYTRELIRVLYNHDKDLAMNVNITNSELVNNTADGIHLELDYFGRGPGIRLDLQNNTFVNTNRTLLAGDQGRRGNSYRTALYINILNNRFLNNFQTTGALIEIEDENNDYVTIEENVFEGNTVQDLVVIYGPTAQSSASDMVISTNKFLFNTATNAFITLSNYHPLTLRSNVFESNTAPCYLQAPAFRSGDTYEIVDARRNYWGSGDFVDVMDRVCGFEKNMEHSLIHYIPYYTDRALTTLSPYLQDDFDIQGFIGGDLTRDLVFSSTNFQLPVRITISIFIRYNCFLDFLQD